MPTKALRRLSFITQDTVSLTKPLKMLIYYPLTASAPTSLQAIAFRHYILRWENYRPNRAVLFKKYSAGWPDTKFSATANSGADRLGSAPDKFLHHKKQHGLFTYYILKKLQSSKGNITLGDLQSYVRDEVAKRSIVVNGKSQTPTIAPSANIGEDWKSWTLR